VLIFVCFVDAIGFMIILPLLPFYAVRLHATPETVGRLIASFSIAQLVAAPVWGRVSDRYGRRPIMIGFAALSLVATAVLITGRWSPAGLYGGRLLTGVVSGTVFTVGTAWVKELSAGSPGALR